MNARMTLPDAGRRLKGAGIVLLALVAAFWHAPAFAQQNPIDGTVRGEVLDERSGAPVVGATVDLIDNVNRIRARGTTDETGAFLLTRIDPGAFRLRVRSVGYSELVTPRWWIESGEAITVVIRVDSEAILLAPLEVVGRSVSASPVLQGFYQRLQYNVGGVFFTREDIEERGPMRITDLLAEVPGARFMNAPGSGDPRRDLIVTFERSLPGPGGGSCPVQVYIDGMLASRGGAVPVDALASPHLLEGIEVYRGLSSVPAEFLSAEARCGVVALWTRRGG
jgi:hypothetical protein